MHFAIMIVGLFGLTLTAALPAIVPNAQQLHTHAYRNVHSSKFAALKQLMPMPLPSSPLEKQCQNEKTPSHAIVLDQKAVSKCSHLI